MKHFSTVLAGAAIVFCPLCTVVQPVAAWEAYKAKIPNGNVYGGGTSHVSSSGGGARNTFGTDFHNLGNKVWTTALCQKDSDGDGQTNGWELGDPDCSWSEGGSFTPRNCVDTVFFFRFFRFLHP